MGFVDRKIRHLAESNSVTILMYHRIINKDKSIQAGMYVSPATFKNQLEVLKKHFNIIPLALLAKGERAATQTESGKPLCVLTFDDGWKDFYDNAYPLLRKNNIPATVFLPTDYIGSTKKFWTDLFAYLLIKRRASELLEEITPHISTIIDQIEQFSGSFEQELESGIEYLKKYPQETIDTVLAVLSKKWQVDLTASARAFLNWKEVNEMFSTGLISFGSHTVNHPILTTMQSTDDIKKEMVDSYECLIERGVSSKSNISFCYPNGSYSDEIANLVSETGFQLAVTTRSGHNPPDHDLFTLSRIGIHQDISSTPSLFRCLTAGLT